jgi:hypothetical protein
MDPEGALALMEYADRVLISIVHLKVRWIPQLGPVTVRPVMPSRRVCLSNQWLYFNR